MNLRDYQERAMETAIYPREHAIIYPALKLASEAGEVAGKVGKVLRDDNGVFSEDKRKELAKEVGDVLWYCAALAHDLGSMLDTIATDNIAKLASRQERGVLGGSGDNR